MTTVETITMDDLVKECNLTDSVELQKILRGRKGLPQVSHRKPIPRKDADAIVKALTGQKINWGKYKERQRDETDDGILTWSDADHILQSVQDWYQQIPGEATADGPFRVVAMACIGGFLSGIKDQDFVLGFHRGINVIIGDRGSGKSTALNLLGIFSDSVENETQVLVDRLLNILGSEKTPADNKLVALHRRILRTMRFYSIQKYGLFFYAQGFLYCYYINRQEKSYSFVKLLEADNRWEFIPESSLYLDVHLLFLSQGEVVRIAEDRGQKFYLNNILDAIYPDLYDERKNLIESVEMLISHAKNYQPQYSNVYNKNLRTFIWERMREIDQMRLDLQRGEFNRRYETMIYEFLYQCKKYQELHPDKKWETIRLVDCLQDTEESAFYFLYVKSIKGFLYRKLADLEELRANSNMSEKDGVLPLRETHPELFKDILIRLGDNQEANKETVSLDQAIQIFENELDDNEILHPELDDRLEIIDIQDGNDENTEQELQEYELFRKKVATIRTNKVSREFIKVAQEVIDRLRERVLVLFEWSKLYAFEREKYVGSLKSLSTEYIKILGKKASLNKRQANSCATLTKELRQDNLAINITTPMAQQTVDELETFSHKLTLLSANYEYLMNASPSIKLKELRTIQYEYDSTLKDLHDELAVLQEQIEKDTQEAVDFFSFPIRIELLQGNIYRDFQQLSFGQKSGIILKMVLTTTKKSVILIDQPEDNLDAYSIINIIAPALKNLRSVTNRQVIVVTHNSNLVMEVNPDYLIALESRGQSGQIKFQGKPVGKGAVREIFEILEGGVETFSQKIKTYENFVGMAKHADDYDIHLIESSFRQRTIDGLRNYLQPIVSDSSMLGFLRHELKQWNPDEFRQHTRKFIEDLEKMEQNPEKGHETLYDMLTGLAEELDSHITRFMTSIDQIRLMDTKPKKEQIHLYELLDKICSESDITNLKRTRRIHITVSDDFKGSYVFADPNHLKLVFKNLLENSLRATEHIGTKLRKKNEYIETVSFELAQKDIASQMVQIIYSDNGCGVSPEMQNRLYREPCSTKAGKDHGLGGIIIRKLLEINGGDIKILESRTGLPNPGMKQKITLSSLVEE